MATQGFHINRHQAEYSITIEENQVLNIHKSGLKRVRKQNNDKSKWYEPKFMNCILFTAFAKEVSWDFA